MRIFKVNLLIFSLIYFFGFKASHCVLAEQMSEQDKLSKLQSKELLGQFTEVQEKNKYSQIKYTIASVSLNKEAAEKFIHGGECAVSCPDGCCDSAEGLKFEGGMFLLLGQQAKIQAQSNYLVALEACRTYNKYALEPKDCGKEVKPFDLNKPEANWYDDKGNCKKSAPPDCQIISLIPGSKIFGNNKLKCKTDYKSPCSEDFYSSYKLNSDGSLTIKTGQRTLNLKLDQFKDKNSLVAAGVPFYLADSLAEQYNKSNLKFQSMGNFAFAGVKAGSISTKSESSMGENDSDSRKNTISSGAVVSSEKNDQLMFKSFNGEPIHMKSADIFEVMSKRYKLIDESLQP